MTITAAAIAALVDFAREAEKAFEAFTQGVATEEQLATLDAVNDLKEARLFAKFDERDRRDAAAQ